MKRKLNEIMDNKIDENELIISFNNLTLKPEKKRKNDLIEYLVTGIENKKDTQVNHYFCSTAREFPDMCGEEGKKWEEDVW